MYAKQIDWFARRWASVKAKKINAGRFEAHSKSKLQIEGYGVRRKEEGKRKRRWRVDGERYTNEREKEKPGLRERKGKEGGRDRERD